jgi:hypothetical protein
MIRAIKQKNREYVVVTTDFELKDKQGTVRVPMYVQVDTSALTPEEYTRITKGIKGLFDRTITLNLAKPKTNEKPWWKKLFN